MEEVQSQDPEDLQDWERVSSNNEDMEERITRTPPPAEKEWNATLGGTLRIRNNDQRRCKDEITQDLKYRHSPPSPPPSPIPAGPSNWSMKEYYWNCKRTRYNIYQCTENMQPTSKVSNKMPLQKEKPPNKNNKTKGKCSRYQQEGYNRRICTSTNDLQ